MPHNVFASSPVSSFKGNISVKCSREGLVIEKKKGEVGLLYIAGLIPLVRPIYEIKLSHKASNEGYGVYIYTGHTYIQLTSNKLFGYYYGYC